MEGGRFFIVALLSPPRHIALGAGELRVAVVKKVNARKTVQHHYRAGSRCTIFCFRFFCSSLPTRAVCRLRRAAVLFEVSSYREAKANQIVFVFCPVRPLVRLFVGLFFFSFLLLVDARMLGWRQLGPPDTESGTNCVRKLQSIDRMVKSHLCFSDWNGAGTVGHNRETRLRKHTHTQALVWSSSSPARRGIF